jgi:hypothetical protein
MNRVRKTMLPLTALALLALLCLSPGAAAKQQPHGVYWGAWVGDQLTGTQPPYDMTAISRFERKVHKGLSLVEFATPFADCSSSPCQHFGFPTTPMTSVRQYGAIPFLSWSSGAIPAQAKQRDFQLSDLIRGRYDAYIRSFATEAAAWGHPFFLRFDWEMNGDWFAWGVGANGNSPSQYAKAWRHVHDIFTKVGATNATWVWCPYSKTSGRYGDLSQYYPGDKYVDWTCLDGYNWANSPVNPRPWMSFNRIFNPAYRLVTTKIAPSKPMMLGEIASRGTPKAKGDWVRQMFETVTKRYQQVGGLIWFDQFDRGIDWPIETARAPLRAFTDGLQGGPFLGPRFGSLEANPIPTLR